MEREREINAVAQLTSSFCLFYSGYDFSCKMVLSTFQVDPLYSVKSPWKCSHGHKQRLVFLNPVKYSMKINHHRCSAAGAQMAGSGRKESKGVMKGTGQQNKDRDEHHELTGLGLPAENQIFKKGHDHFHTSQKCDLDNQGASSTTCRYEGKEEAATRASSK